MVREITPICLGRCQRLCVVKMRSIIREVGHYDPLSSNSSWLP